MAEIVADGKREMMPVPQFDSGAQFIFKPDLSKGGNYAIIVTSKTTYSAFSLQVDMFPGDVVLNPVDIDVRMFPLNPESLHGHGGFQPDMLSQSGLHLLHAFRPLMFCWIAAYVCLWQSPCLPECETCILR